MSRRWSSVSWFAARHLLAGACSTGFLALIPVLIYGGLMLVGIVFYGDMGGLLNIIVVPLMAVALGVAMTVLVYAPLSFAFEVWRRRGRLPILMPPLLVFAGTSLLLSAVLLKAPPAALIHVSLALGLAAYVATGFSIYWFVAVFPTCLANWIKGHPKDVATAQHDQIVAQQDPEQRSSF